MEVEDKTNDEIPESLKRLVRIMLRAFYSFEHCLIIDILIRNRCIKEEDLISLSKFDKKQLRAILATIKMEKILKSKTLAEPTPGAEPDENGVVPKTKYVYYFINYRTTINIIKFKLHKMREKIESQERDNSNRASFICPMCKNTYTDLQVDQLLDPMSGKLFCCYCRTEVEEDASAGPKTDSRTVLAKFNTQIAPIYDALRETENIEFTPTMTDPFPSFVHYLHSDKDDDVFVGSDGRVTRKTDKQQNEDNWRGGAGRPGFSDDINIIIDHEDKVKETKVAKEQPSWLVNSTVVKKEEDYMADFETENTFKPVRLEAEMEDIDDLLRTTEQPAIVKPKPVNPRTQKDPIEESSEDEFIDSEALTVQGKEYSYEDISEDPSLVEKMTEAEQNAYQEYMTQQMAYM